MVHVANLTASTAYNVSVTMINSDFEYSEASNNGQLWYTQSVHTPPSFVKNVSFGNFTETFSDEKTTLDVTVYWEPTEGKI